MAEKISHTVKNNPKKNVTFNAGTNVEKKGKESNIRKRAGMDDAMERIAKIKWNGTCRMIRRWSQEDSGMEIQKG